MTNTTTDGAEIISAYGNADIIRVDGDIKFELIDNTEVITSTTVTESIGFTSSEPLIVNKIFYELNNTATTGTPKSSITYNRIVTSESGKLVHADKDSEPHHDLVIGMAINSGLVLDIINILVTGAITDLTWDWTPDRPLYLGNDGLMTEVKPTEGFILQVAHTISATEIWIDIRTVHQIDPKTISSITVSADTDNQLTTGDDELLFVPSSDKQSYVGVSPYLIYLLATS